MVEPPSWSGRPSRASLEVGVRPGRVRPWLTGRATEVASPPDRGRSAGPTWVFPSQPHKAPTVVDNSRRSPTQINSARFVENKSHFGREARYQRQAAPKGHQKALFIENKGLCCPQQPGNHLPSVQSNRGAIPSPRVPVARLACRTARRATYASVTAPPLASSTTTNLFFGASRARKAPRPRSAQPRSRQFGRLTVGRLNLGRLRVESWA